MLLPPALGVGREGGASSAHDVVIVIVEDSAAHSFSPLGIDRIVGLTAAAAVVVVVAAVVVELVRILHGEGMPGGRPPTGIGESGRGGSTVSLK